MSATTKGTDALGASVDVNGRTYERNARGRWSFQPRNGHQRSEIHRTSRLHFALDTLAAFYVALDQERAEQTRAVARGQRAEFERDAAWAELAEIKALCPIGPDVTLPGAGAVHRVRHALAQKDKMIAMVEASEARRTDERAAAEAGLVAVRALEFTPTKLTHLRDLAEVCRAQSIRRDGSCSDPSVPAAWSARWRTLDQFVIPAVELLGRVTGATPCDHTPELPIGGGVPFCAKCGHSFRDADLPDFSPDNA